MTWLTFDETDAVVSLFCLLPALPLPDVYWLGPLPPREGHIVTNYHVIREANELGITIGDGPASIEYT